MVKKYTMQEIKSLSLEKLQEIQDYQSDLYTEEEMMIISQQALSTEVKEREAAAAKKKADEEFIARNHPDTIICPDCGGVNSFRNVRCASCGRELDKSKYYDPEYYKQYPIERAQPVSQPESVSYAPAENTVERSYGMHYLFSVLIPLVGFIMGAIFMTKDDSKKIHAGQNCIWFAIASMIVFGLIFLRHWIKAFGF